MIYRRALRISSLIARQSVPLAVHVRARVLTHPSIGLARFFSEENDEGQKKRKVKGPTQGKAKEIPLDEALQIFGIEDENKIDVEALKKKWAILKKNNNVEKGGSPYLYHKIRNALERISKHLKIKSSELDTVEEKVEEETKEEEKNEEKKDK